MKNLLITGTDGFIGSKLLENLSGNVDNNIYTINGDIFLKDSWVSDLKQFLNNIKPEVIFHVGACSDTLEQDVNYMMTRNFESTKVLMDYSKENSIPLIYSSSAANYGTNSLYPSNLYGWSKYVAEQYVISNGGVALRYFNVYGPGEENKGRMASVAYQMYLKSKTPESIFLFPKKPQRDFVYIYDVISANIFAWEHYEDVRFKYYEVGSGDARSFEDVLNFMSITFEYVGESKIPNGYQFYTCSNEEKWMKGWKPTWNLKMGINDYLKYLNK